MWPGFKSRRGRHMWVEFVVGSLPCSERFFSGYSGFPLSSKTSISKFQFDQESGRRRTTLWMCYLQIVIFYFYNYLFISYLPSAARAESDKINQRQMRDKMARHKQCQKLGENRNADLTAAQGVTPQTFLIHNTTKLLHSEGGWVTKLL